MANEQQAAADRMAEKRAARAEHERLMKERDDRIDELATEVWRICKAYFPSYRGSEDPGPMTQLRTAIDGLPIPSRLS